MTIWSDGLVQPILASSNLGGSGQAPQPAGRASRIGGSPPRSAEGSSGGGDALLPLPAEAERPVVVAPERSGAPRVGPCRTDWVQAEGKRDPSMVAYLGSWWSRYVNFGERGASQGVDVYIKLQVRWVEGANLDGKRVGVISHTVYGWDQPWTSLGSFSHTFFQDGERYEEWHVPVYVRSFRPGSFLFAAWYQDGRGGTWYDDNEGEYHPLVYDGSYTVIRVDPDTTRLRLTGTRVQGLISLLLANLDYHKDIRLVCTTDRWAHRNGYGMGEPGQPNSWHWVESLYGGYERWEMNLDLPATSDQFEYAVVYRHGVVNGARAYEFWDNNGGVNHVVSRQEG